MNRLEDDQGKEQTKESSYFLSNFSHLIREKKCQKVSNHRRGEETAACRGGRTELGGVKVDQVSKRGCRMRV